MPASLVVESLTPEKRRLEWVSELVEDVEALLGRRSDVVPKEDCRH
jgi:hypothetical protein